MLNWANKNPGYILILLIAVSFICADGLRVINYPPKAVHQWRQSDCMAYAKTYYQKGTGLFTPSTYNLAGREGRVVSEFPIIYFIGGQLFKVFGIHYLILRGLTFICFLLGLFYLYRFMGLWMKHSLITLFPIIILATSPFYYYYALNFLPNVPAISFSFAGLYYLVCYLRGGSTRQLIIGTLFVILATLLKPTDGGLLWVAYLGVCFFQFLQGKIKAKRAIAVAVSAMLISASIVGWYFYGEWYNGVNGNHENLQSIYPIWQMDHKYAVYVWKERILDFWSASYQQRTVLYFMVVLAVIYLVRLRVLHPFLRLITFLTFLGTIVYDILWYKAFSDHDYYLLVNIFPCILLLITVTEWFTNRLVPTISKKVIAGVGALLAVLVAISIYHNTKIQDERYHKPIFQYMNPDIYSAEPFLRQLGIKSTDVIVSVPDPSPNITLAAYGTQGYTESLSDEYFNINLYIKVGAKYLVICDSTYLNKPLYAPHTKKLMGKFRNNIFVFDLR